MTGSFTYTSTSTRWNYCPQCGRRLESEWTYCPGCGRAIGNFAYGGYSYYPYQPWWISGTAVGGQTFTSGTVATSDTVTVQQLADYFKDNPVSPK